MLVKNALCHSAGLDTVGGALAGTGFLFQSSNLLISNCCVAEKPYSLASAALVLPPASRMEEKHIYFRLL